MSACSPPEPEERYDKRVTTTKSASFPPVGKPLSTENPICGCKNKDKQSKTRIPLQVGAWNVRTLMDNAAADRPMRRTALVAKELSRYNIDIAALSETRFADEGQLKEIGSGYTFYWSGRKQEERREAGVGFAIKNTIINNLSGLPKGHNDRLMSLRLPLVKDKHISIISAYAPTMTNPEDIKDKFYEDLDRLIQSISKDDKLLILGDFNARVGTDYNTWEGIIGRNGVGKCNSNGLLLLKTCAEHSLQITNTFFRLPHRNRTSWMHPRSRQWHLIDYALTRQKDRHDILVTKSMCGADCWTDHKLIVTKLALQVQKKRRPQGKKIMKKINAESLNDPSTKSAFIKDLSDNLNSTNSDPTDPEANWASLKMVIHSASKSHLGKPTRKHQDWFDANDKEIEALLTEKNILLKEHLNDKKSKSKEDRFKEACKALKPKLEEMQNKWLAKKAEDIQLAADCNNSKQFYDGIKAIYGPQSTGSSPVYDQSGTSLLTEKKDILHRWADHSNTILNRPSAISDEAIESLPQIELNQALDQPPTVQEVEKAIKALSTGKAPGADAIPAEIFKAGGMVLVTKLTELFSSVWAAGSVPQDFKDAVIVYAYKRKGNRNSCDNYRGISLLSIAGKMLARLLLNRLLSHIDELLPESQCGFRAGRGTADMVFAARQVQEKFQEQNREVFTTFVDLTKAFDTVSRAGLWKIMTKYGIPDKFLALVRSFHEGMQASVSIDGDFSDPFEVTNGVKQGCVLAPTLFSIMFSGMLKSAFPDNEDSIAIKWRTDGGGLLKLSRLSAKTKVHNDYVRDLLFADDCALNASSEEAMQRSMDKLSSACDAFGLTISVKKTEVLHQPAPNNTQPEKPAIKVNGQCLQTVNHFTYLGSTLSSNVVIDKEIETRLAKASVAFGRLRKSVWDRKGLTIQTKLKVYQAMVLTALLYASETWTVYARHEKVLNRFHINCLRKLLHITWQEHIPDTEVLERTKMPSVQTLLRKNQLRWAGHVARMDDTRLPKQLLYCMLAEGERNHGRQKKRFKDTLKTSMKDFGIDPDSWEDKATNRSAWRSSVNRGAKKYEKGRIKEAKQKRALRKARASSTLSQPGSFTCTVCNRSFNHHLGLYSHSRTHKTT